MANKSSISDEEMLKLLKEYYYVQNHENEKSLKCSLITEFINKSGYPNYKATSLRRNKTAREFIDGLKQAKKPRNTQRIVYRTLDVNTFLDKHSSKESLKRSLIELDAYYKSIYDYAIEFQKKYEQVDELKNNIATCNQEIESLNSENKSLKKEIREKNQTIKALKDYIEDYVEPDVAAEVLHDLRISAPNDIINVDSLQDKIIDSSTDIAQYTAKSKSNIIQGLFNKRNK